MTNWPQRHNLFHENPLTPRPPRQLATPEISHEIEGAVQIPHPLEDSDNQILSSRDGKGVKCPGYARRGGGWRWGWGGVGEMLKFRFDRYITVESPAFAQTSSMNEDKIFHAGSMKKLVVETTIYEK